MAESDSATHELDLSALTIWMQANLANELAGPLASCLIAGGRSNPTYELTDGIRHWILRRPPYGEILQSAHDMLRETTVMGALAGSAVPVPNVVGLCRDHEVLGAG